MMKKFTYSTAIALAVAIASAGCAHKPYAVTPIPPVPTAVADQNPNTISQPPPVETTPVTPQPLAESTQFDIHNWDQDRSAFAADTVHFAYDSAVIRDTEASKIQAVAAALNSDKSANVMIEGNCDERGTEEYNRSLGERRSEAAREALVGMGIDVSRVHTISYGKDKPADSGHNEAAWKQNRRDDFVLLHPKSGA
jgi:peptidoglycan-associated lipoprotein